MAVTPDTDNVVREYLRDLEFAVRFCGVRARVRYVNEIRDHILEGLSTIDANDDDAVRALLRRIGRPEDLAVELMEAQRLGQPNYFRRSIERNGPRRLILQFVAALVAVAVLVGLLLAHSYQPIAPQGFEFSSEVRSINGTPAQNVPDNAPTFLNVPKVWIEPKGHFKIQTLLDIYNEGSFPVSITSVTPYPFGYPQPRVKVQFDSRDNFVGGARFHPFKLGGRDDQVLLVTLYQVCQSVPHEDLSMGYIPVTYSYFGFQHTVNVNVQPFWLQMLSHC